MSYVVKIGGGYFASDDQPAVSTMAAAAKFPTRKRAESEAGMARSMWEVDPDDVTVVPVPVGVPEHA